MIVVDTNILSEPFRRDPARQVLAWMADQDAVAASAVSIGEMRRGALALPKGRRRDEILAHIDAVFAEHVDRILSYNGASARVFAHLHAQRRSQGRPLAVEDGMIAATALIHGATAIATRNVRDFEGLGLGIINPWDA